MAQTPHQNDVDNSDPVDVYEHILEHEDRDTQVAAVAIDKTVKGVGNIVMWANLSFGGRHRDTGKPALSVQRELPEAR